MAEQENTPEEDSKKEQPVNNKAESFFKLSHHARIKKIEALSFEDACEIYAQSDEIPEGYLRILSYRFESLMEMCFPDHYCFYKKNGGALFFTEMFEALKRAYERAEMNMLQTSEKKTFKNVFDQDDLKLLGRLIEAVSSNDISIIEADIPGFRTYIFSECLDVLRYCQFANLNFLKEVHKRASEYKHDPQTVREWTLIADDIDALMTGWKDKHEDRTGINWLKFFSEEVEDILKLGTPGTFFSLLDYLANNGVNIVRHGPYLEDLLNTIVRLKRFNLFKMLIEKYNIKRFNWFSLIPSAAATGQIALIEILIKLESDIRTIDVMDVRFSVMESSVRNGYFNAFIYFFEQCTDEELKQDTKWCQAIMVAISWGSFELFKKLIDHPCFSLKDIKSELSYMETKDDADIKKHLRALTPVECLLQKSLASEVDSIGSFEITKYIINKYVKSFDVNKFLEFKSEDLDFSKTMYLYKFVGIDKKYLNFSLSFFSTTTNMRRFFYCYYFSKDDLRKHVFPSVVSIHESEYQTDKDAVATFRDLAYPAEYYVKETDLAKAIYDCFHAYVSGEIVHDEPHVNLIKTCIQQLDRENLPEAKELFKVIKDTVKSGCIPIKENTFLLRMLRGACGKLGERVTSVERMNRIIKGKR